MSQHRVKAWGWAAVVLVILALLPIWLFPYFPTQDGPSHLYNAHILAEYWNPNFVYSQYFQIQWQALPNWFSQAVLALLMKVVSPFAAEKIFLSFYVLFFLGCMAYFFRAVQPDRFPYDSVLLSFFFVYHFYFQMGFWNFSFGVAMFFGLLGFWWKHRNLMRWTHYLWLHLGLGCLYFTHLLPFVLLLGALAGLSVLCFFRERKLLLRTWLWLLPAVGWLGFYLPHSELSSSTSAGWFTWGALLERVRLILFYPLVSLHPYQTFFSYGVGALIIVGCILTLVLSRRSKGCTESKEASPEEGAISLRWPIVLLALGLFLGYLVAPRSLGSALWLNSRFSLLGWLCLLACLRLPANWMGQVFRGVLVVVLVGNFAHFTYLCSKLSQDLEHYVRVTRNVKPKGVYLPLHYRSGVKAKGLPTGKVQVDRSYRVHTHLHAISYACMDKGAINLANYEAELDYFPVSFRKAFLQNIRSKMGVPPSQKFWIPSLIGRPQTLQLCGLSKLVDNIVVWGFPVQRSVRFQLARCYKPLVAWKPVFVFGRKEKPKLPPSRNTQ
ncbi:MAG: hypothetical protein EP343_09905 [Deltaproteobacteria bacterium]|nr:MAG: hypothetical protein EP343_09905 [Deltaproteobacteria bacterium]